jgi:YVTN family beta-propeller protein
VDGQSIWVASHYSNVVTRIDAQTNAVIASIPLSGYPSSAHIDGDCCGQTLAVGAGAVWTIAGSDQRTLVRIDPRTDHVTASLTFSQPMGPVAFATGSVWVQSDNTLYRINPSAMKRS